MKTAVSVLFFAGVVGAVTMYAQGTKDVQSKTRIDPCDTMPTGPSAAKHFLPFAQFDTELRVALTRQDPLLLAVLVKFPLVVNDDGGSISINDPQALQTHIQEIFTPAVRKAILGDHSEKTGCLEAGLFYANGVIWVGTSERGYAIDVVNRDSVPPYSTTNKPAVPHIEYICQTKGHRIVVDTVTGGTIRYRSWNRPRPLTDRPDLELLNGDRSFEGTQVCAMPTYTFENGKTVYKVYGGTGCTETPKDATGDLEVTISDGEPQTLWCY